MMENIKAVMKEVSEDWFLHYNNEPGCVSVHIIYALVKSDRRKDTH